MANKLLRSLYSKGSEDALLGRSWGSEFEYLTQLTFISSALISSVNISDIGTLCLHMKVFILQIEVQ